MEALILNQKSIIENLESDIKEERKVSEYLIERVDSLERRITQDGAE